MQSVIKCDSYELRREDIRVDPYMEVDCDIGEWITAYIETWFDVDRKFGLHINDDEDAWLNMYARYNPFEDKLEIECVISRPDSDDCFEYVPSDREARLIKDMIEEVLEKEHTNGKALCMSFWEGNDD